MRITQLAGPVLLALAALASPVSSQDLTWDGSPDGTRVPPSVTARIDRHEVCREVTNGTSSPIMIPHRSATEWAVGGGAFLENPYPGVTVAPCATGLCDPDGVVPGDPSLLYTVDRETTHIYFDGSVLHAVTRGGVRAYSVTENGATEVATTSLTTPPGFAIVGFGGAATGPADIAVFLLGRNPSTGHFNYRRVYLAFDGDSYSDVTSSYSVSEVTGSQAQTESVSDLHEFRLDASTNEIVITEIATGNIVNSLNHGSSSLSFSVAEDGMNLVVYSSSGAHLYSFDGSEFLLGATLPTAEYNGFLGRDLFWRDATSGSGAEILKIGTGPSGPTRIGGVSAFSLSSSSVFAWMGTHDMVYASIMNIVRIDGTDLIAVADARKGMRVMRLETEDCPAPPPEPPVATTIYDVAPCSVSAGGGDQSTSTACGPEYETGLDMAFSTTDGTCEAPGLARLRRMVGQNLAASFWHGYLCQEVQTGRPGHFHLGEFAATDTALRDTVIGGALHVVPDPFTVSGLTGDGVLSWQVGGWAQGAAVRINGGAWVTSGTAPAASRTVRNGDLVEFALRTGGSDANALNWALLTLTPAGSPELSLTRDLAVIGSRTVSISPLPPPPAPEPVYEPLTAGGPISTTNEAHPVFQLFQSCFQVPPGSHLSFPNACTLDSAFWSDFETAACAPSPHDLTVSMGGFALGSSGDVCSEVGFEEFVGRAKASTCEPASCAIQEDGPASCVFSCE